MSTFTAGFQTPPSVRDGSPVSAGDINLLIHNAEVLDQLSRLPRPAHNFISQRFELNDANPLYAGWYSGQFRTGLTTLTIVTQSTLSGDGLAERLRVKITANKFDPAVNGTTRYEAALTAGEQTHSITISGLGFIDLDILMVDIEVYTNAVVGGLISQNWGVYDVTDAYLSPFSSVALVAGSWPGVPSLGPVNAANVNQLAAAQDWLLQRMDVVPRPLFQMVLYHQGQLSTGTHSIWNGSVVRSALHDRLRVPVLYTIFQTPNTSIRIRINDAVVDTIGPLAVGASAFTVRAIDISGYSVGTRLRVRLEEFISPYVEPDVRPPVPSRFSVTGVETYTATPVADAPPVLVGIGTNYSYAAVQGRFNGVAAMVSNAYARLAADTWDRVRLFRRNYGYDAGQQTYYSTVFVPLSVRRVGAALWLAGRGIRAGYGGAAVVAKPGDLYTYTYTFEPSLLPGGSFSSARISLGALDGLGVGVPYILQGNGAEIAYAAEELR